MQDYQPFLLSDSAMQAASYSTYENFRSRSTLGLSEIKAWKQKISHFQLQRQSQLSPTEQQGSLFGTKSRSPSPIEVARGIEPFLLQRQNTQFWRWRFEDVGVAAMYFVIDYAVVSCVDTERASGQPLLLYVGETIKSNQRWKGEHDCKRYLLNYRQAHYDNGLATELGITFWPKAPTDRKVRQQIESALIRHWRSPFNKENWHFWNTPFVDGKR